MSWILRNWLWLAVALGVGSITFVAQYPKAGKVYGCPECGKAFRISLAEYYACERKGDDRLVDCRYCRKEVWARLLHREWP